MFVVSTCWVSVLRELFHEKCLGHRIVWNLPKAFLKGEPSGPVVLTLCLMLCVPPEHAHGRGGGKAPAWPCQEPQPPPWHHVQHNLPCILAILSLTCTDVSQGPGGFSCFLASALPGLPRLYCRHIVSLQVFVSL